MTFDTSHEDDIVQEVFLKAWLHLASFRSESSFRTWITRIAMNEVLQFYRRARQSPICPALADLDTFASSFESPHQSLERRESTQRVRKAIAKLPSTYRDILVLGDLEQLSAVEIAHSLQGSISMVKTRLFRARQLLSVSLHRQHRRISHKADLAMARARAKSQIEPLSKAA